MGLPFFMIVAVMGLCAVSGDSLWIDEAHCAVAAIQPGFSGWLRCLLEVPSDVQMSVYFFQLWGWEKIAGGGEWMLRLNNLPWFALGVGAWFFALPRALRLPLALVAGLSPFLWYYVNELRPYTMVFAGSSMMFAGLYRLGTAGFSRGWFWCFGMGSVLAAAASSTAIPWVGVAGLAMGFLLFRRRPAVPIPRKVYGITGILAVPGLFIIGLYAWSFLQGARAASPEPSSLGSLLFVPYELLGFVGLGPGRGELRAGGVMSLKPYLPLIGVLAVSLAAVLIAGIGALRKHVGGRRLLAGSALFVLPVIAVIGLGLFSGLRTTGRHFTPALALLLPLSAVGLNALWASRKSAYRVAVIGFLICWAGSSVELRTAARHKKDNYREATRIAREAVEGGKQVWWLADPCGAEYYRLPLALGEEAEPSKARRIVNLETLPSPRPDIVVFSRADVYDRSETVAAGMLASGPYHPVRTLQGFVIWERRAEIRTLNQP